MLGRTLPLAAAALIGLVALGDLATTSSQAAGQPRSEAEIEEIVRNYLLKNPEVLFEAADLYREKQRALASAASEEAARMLLPELRATPAGHLATAPSGNSDVTVIEFFDYNCGVCRMATDFVFDLQDEDPNVDLILQELPVTNRASRDPALAALSVAGTEYYMPYHRKMMSATELVNAELAATIATDLKLPPNVIRAALSKTAAQNALHDRLDRSIDIADELGIDGTPAFLIASNDGSFVRIVGGYYPEDVRAAIAEARQTASR